MTSCGKLSGGCELHNAGSFQERLQVRQVSRRIGQHGLGVAGVGDQVDFVISAAALRHPPWDGAFSTGKGLFFLL